MANPDEHTTPTERVVRTWGELAGHMEEVLRTTRRMQRGVLAAAYLMLGVALAAFVAMTLLVWAIRGEVRALIDTQVKREAALAAQRAVKQRGADQRVAEELERQVARSALESVKTLPEPPPRAVVEQLEKAVQKPPAQAP